MKFRLLNRFFRAYMHSVHNGLFYRSVEVVGRENLPQDSEGLIVVANHQNALGDPLLLENCFGSHPVTIFAMGAALNAPVFGAFLRWLGLLPAYRMRTDGEESLSKNAAVFDEAGERLLDGHYVAIFPEATNQTRRWLGEFSEGYLRMAFETAESTGFARDIRILPAAIHYSNWFSMQSDVMIRFGETVSLQPYYELYKTKPRTARRTVNAKVREAVQGMMLDVRDEDNYKAIDYILRRERRNISIPLSERLQREKRLAGRCEDLAAQDPRLFSEKCGEILELKQFTRSHGFRDWLFDVRVQRSKIIYLWTFTLLTLPLFLFSMVPNWLVYLAPIPLVRKVGRIGEKFELFASGIRFLVSAMVTMPVLWVGTMVVEGIFLTWWLAVAHLLLQPFLLLYAWRYMQKFRRLVGATRFLHLLKSPEMDKMVEKRKSIINYIYG